jgi:hypothetical protein
VAVVVTMVTPVTSIGKPLLIRRRQHYHTDRKKIPPKVRIFVTCMQHEVSPGSCTVID